MTTNASYGAPSGYGSAIKTHAQPPSAPLPHIEDLLAIPRDIDTNQSMKRLLEMAETSLRQAEISRDFHRPAIALKDYIRASIIAIQIISKHKDYHSLRSPSSELSRSHNALLKRISHQSEAFEKIKREIIQDNKRTGVQPTVKRSSSPLPPPTVPGSDSTPASPTNGTAAIPNSQTLTNGHAQYPVNSSPGKKKPAVLPKPQALHGNAIPTGHGRAAPLNNGVLDLTARFANLRGPQSSPGQDPRIRTYPIPTQKPSGPRQMPSHTQLGLDTESAVSALPKVPDAIYSPARGSVSGETSRFPTTAPRGVFSRNASSASLSSVQGLSQTQSNAGHTAPKAPIRDESELQLDLPESGTISAQQLYQTMKSRHSILLIDVRSREEFDDGHIMSSSIICIEPSILLRDNITSDEISESMVLSPNPEQSLFDKRDTYDLVVFYDQSSESVPQIPRNSDELVVVSLHRALVHLSYGHDLRRPPRLLNGGLNAWIDFLGPQSLQSTARATPIPSTTPRWQKRKGFIQQKGYKYQFGSLPPADVRAWETTLERDARQAATQPSFPRTGDEFLKSTPLPAQKQSMSTPAPPVPVRDIARQQSRDLMKGFGSSTHLPDPPARPCAAVQRPSHSRLPQGDDDHETFNGSSRPKKGMEQLPGPIVKAYTGLVNPRNWCYANSTLQALLASPGFGRELTGSEWAHNYSAIPRKGTEAIDPPQLMIRIISNLYYWMSGGNFPTLKAQTLMDYSLHLCKSGNSTQVEFGGPDQQDAQEFMSFVIEQLHDETNHRRNLEGTAEHPAETAKRSPILGAMEYWTQHSKYSKSIVDYYWRGIELSTVECHHCRTKSYKYETFTWLSVPVDHTRGRMTLDDILSKRVTDGGLISEYKCESCHKMGANRTCTIARMPRLLCISLGRFNLDGKGGYFKTKSIVTWNLNDMDFSPYFEASSGSTKPTGDQAFSGPFRYECYAVILHAGRQVNTGHYYAYVRDSTSHDQSAWYCCDDDKVRKKRFNGGDANGDAVQEIFGSSTEDVPYLVFFRRRDE
ncbi:hypothetical protein HIM_09450 [Hirsutella minnesotensis 3608]|uniref:USP domain-containing protein n=1 Tax=Hirsutella minnesotensis 3608 TaxID=1043627 RepID=A0A0F7ZGM5_9HYPO|nr:hypothetical protein HIM_09450 [Hirsutella minnesotensis 3608]